MLTVIIDARTEAERLPGLLAQLTAGAVDGLVRQVVIVAPAGDPEIAALCEDMGAGAAATLPAAAAMARAERLLVAPARFRLRDGWIGALSRQLAEGATSGLVVGQGDGGLFRRPPYAVLLERDGLKGGDGADLQGLRRELGLRPRRLG